MGNFGISLWGDVNQVIINISPPATSGLPPGTRLRLRSFDLSDAVAPGRTPDLFNALRWDYALAQTLYGRDAELKAIIEWAEASEARPSIQVRLVTGAGGSGKTRLATEAARHLIAKGWTGGFMPRDESFLYDISERGLFLIVDYPEEQIERIRAIFAKLASLDPAPYRLRLLLLSRRSFEEWRAESRSLGPMFGIQAIAGPGPLSVKDARALISEASTRFATAAGIAIPDTSGAEEWLSQHISHRLPLFAAAAAIHAGLSPNEAFGLHGSELLQSLAVRERSRVREISRNLTLGDDGLERLLALAIIADGLNSSTIADLQKAGAIDSFISDVVGAVANSPWWRSGRLAPLEPDRAAAAFVELVLFPADTFPRGRHELPDWLFIALKERASTFPDRLGRLLFDLAALKRTESGEHPLGPSLVEMLRRAPARSALFQSILLRPSSIWNAPFAVEVITHLLSITDEKPRQAALLKSLAIGFATLRQYDKALSAAIEGTRIYRELANNEPTTYGLDLAGSLNNLAAAFTQVGNHLEALPFIDEAERIYQRHFRKNPNADTHDLARCLDTYANILSSNNRHGEALRRAQEATEFYRRLANERPEVFTSDFARCLSNLAPKFEAVGRSSEAFDRSEEAITIWRTLHSRYPDNYASILAGSLNNHANRLSALERFGEAIALAREAIAMFQELDGAHPNVFTYELALGYGALARALAAYGQHEDALRASAEGIMKVASFIGVPKKIARRLALPLSRVYIDSCKALNRDPDQVLLKSIMPLIFPVDYGDGSSGA